MNSVNQFYKLRLKNSDFENEYDIEELDEKSLGMSDPFIYSSEGRLFGETNFRLTTKKDYENQFFSKILKIKPIYNVPEFLNYHYQNYCLNNSDKELFIKHIEYEILPRLQGIVRTTFAELTKEWITKNKTMNLIEQEIENVVFLRRAYDEALKFSPSGPLSVKINTFELGKVLGFDETKVKRIVNELVNNRYLSSTLGMMIIIVEQKGLDFLRSYEKSDNTNKSETFNFNNISGSQILIQKDNSNSSQSLQIIDFKVEDIKKIVTEIESKYEELSKHLSTETANELKAEIEYLNNNLKKESPKQEKLKTIMNEIKNILVAIPSNVIANILSQPIVSMLYNS